MISNTQLIIDGINKKLENIDRVIISQDKEIKELRGILSEVYEELYKKKLTIEKYKETCGSISSKKSKRTNYSRGKITSKS